MVILFNFIHRGIDLFFLPFSGFEPFWGMLAISAFTGVLMVVVYKFTSNQDGIARAKERIRGHLLETWIYREQVRVMLCAQKKVLLANLKYMGLNLKPLAVMLAPILLIMINLNLRFGTAPLAPGERGLIKAARRSAVLIEEMNESLDAPAGVMVETLPVRLASQGETYWRFKVDRPGNYILKIKASGVLYEKSLQAARQVQRVAPLRSANALDEIFYPGEPAMPEGPLKSIEVMYRSESPLIPGTHWRPHWIIQYLVLSIIFGLAIRGPLKVEI